MSDSEDDEKLINYADLLRIKQRKKKGNSSQKGVKRGAKQNTSDELTEQKLETSRQALFECLLVQESQQPNVKQLSEGRLDMHASFLTVITKSKGTHLHSMGFSRAGSIHLYPEEAAFLISRNALVVTAGDSQLCDYETYCDIMCNGKDSWITYDKYQVYAYLKRLGYIVMRASAEDSDEEIVFNSDINGNSNTSWQIFSNAIKMWLDHRTGGRPLLWDYKVNDYKTAYSTLQIIPSTPWYRPFRDSNTTSAHSTMFDWDVYRPRPTWKKRDPGPPDFKIKVQNMHDPMPTLLKYNQFFSQMEDAPSNKNYIPMLTTTKLKDNGPAFIVALVGNAEGVLFLRLTGDGLEDISGKEKQPIQKKWRQKQIDNNRSENL